MGTKMVKRKAPPDPEPTDERIDVQVHILFRIMFYFLNEIHAFVYLFKGHQVQKDGD